MNPRIFVLSTSMILASSLSQLCHASPVVIPGRACVNASVAQVVNAVTDYSRYSKIPEATYTLGPIKVLKMTKSEAIAKDKDNHDDSIVLIELRPMNFGDDKMQLFPRFMTRCQLTRSSDQSAHHNCHWLTTQDLADYGRPGEVPPAFALSDFHSDLQIEQGGSCDSGQTELSYTVSIQPKSEDVARIQQAAGFGGFPMTEELFFQGYYEHFYNGWINRIGRN